MADLSAAIAAAREAVRELDGFKHPELADAYLAHCVGTLRDLLAALDAAQPVVWAIEPELERALNRKDGGYGGLVCLAPDKCRGDMVPLYAAPQAPPAAVPAGYVPDAVEEVEEHHHEDDCNCQQVGYSRGWNACRAAMLAANKENNNG